MWLKIYHQGHKIRMIYDHKTFDFTFLTNHQLNKVKMKEKK